MIGFAGGRPTVLATTSEREILERPFLILSEIQNGIVTIPVSNFPKNGFSFCRIVHVLIDEGLDSREEVIITVIAVTVKYQIVSGQFLKSGHVLSPQELCLKHSPATPAG